MTKNDKVITVVIPAYKAEKYILQNLKNVSDVLKTTGYKFEIICVVDGRLDKTYSIANRYSKTNKNIKVYGYKVNKGKGHAVRYGMVKAKGDIVGFIDAGIDLDPGAMKMLLAHFEWYNADVIIGSKRHPVSQVEYPWQRRILSFGYQNLVRLLFHLNVRDTQVGIKFFKAEVVKKLLPRVLVKTFAFDIEMLAVANYLGYRRIYEAPINIKMEFSDSSIVSKGFLKTIFWMLWDTLAVFYRLRIVDYYNYKNRGKWLNQD